MTEPELLDPLPPRPGTARPLMHVLYAMHTLSWLTLGVLAVLAVMVNFIRCGDAQDPFEQAHHRYMLRTFWWTLLWLAVTAPLYLLFILPGAVAHGVVGLWYLYRCLRGWLRLADGRLP